MEICFNAWIALALAKHRNDEKGGVDCFDFCKNQSNDGVFFNLSKRYLA